MFDVQSFCSTEIYVVSKEILDDGHRSIKPKSDEALANPSTATAVNLVENLPWPRTSDINILTCLL